MTTDNRGAVIIDTASAKSQRKQWRNPTDAIRAKCLDCCGGQPIEVRLCVAFDCPLWSCRMGSRPSTLERKRPSLLDPTKVAADSIRRYAAEGGSGTAQEIAATPEKRQPVGDFSRRNGNPTTESGDGSEDRFSGDPENDTSRRGRDRSVESNGRTKKPRNTGCTE